MTKPSAGDGLSWMNSGEGSTPRVRWTFATDAPLVDFDCSRETGETVAVDESGGLYVLDRRGRILNVSRGFTDVERLRWSDSGNGGVLLMRGDHLVRLGPDLSSRWKARLPDESLDVAIDAFGNHFAVSLANRATQIYDWNKRCISQVVTMRPLSFLQFIAMKQQFVGSAEHGLLCCHNLKGEEIWKEHLWSNVGDVSVTGKGGTVLVAGFNHGVQLFDGEGVHRGSYMMEGSPSRVSTSFVPERVACATIEKHVYWLDSDGELLWAAKAGEDIVGVETDALGNGFVLGLESGRLVRLVWASEAGAE